MNKPLMRQPLSNQPLHKTTRIISVGGERSFRRRLMEMGLLPGTDVVITNVAPLGDPLELQVRGGRLSIRRHEAHAILVDAT
ncbi:MAG: FeoA family protein [Myxococcota bacterium]